MKEFIVMIAFLPIMVVLIATPLKIETNFAKENYIREEVYDMTEKAAQDGCFKENALNNFKRKIANLTGCKEDDIKINVDDFVVYRPNAISYRIEVPLKNALPGNKLFGISDAKNVKSIVIEGKIASERLVRD